MDRQLVRRITQLAILLVILVGLGGSIMLVDRLSLGYFSWFCPFYYLQSIPVWLGAGIGPLLILLLAVFLGVTVLTLLLGRVFCSWICPFGTVLDVAGAARDEKKKHGFPEFLKDRTIKYGILIGFVVAAFVLQRPAFCDVCPAGALYRTVGPAYVGDFSPWLFVPVGILVAVLISSIIYDTRGWCKYLCPLGAYLAIVDRLGLKRSRVRMPIEKCMECFMCNTSCVMGIPVLDETKWKDENRVPPGECIRCYACIDNCPMKDRTPLKLSAAQDTVDSEAAG